MLNEKIRDVLFFFIMKSGKEKKKNKDQGCLVKRKIM